MDFWDKSKHPKVGSTTLSEELNYYLPQWMHKVHQGKHFSKEIFTKKVNEER